MSILPAVGSFLVSCQRFLLFRDTVMIAVGAEHAAVAGQRPQMGATPGTPVENQSVIRRNIQCFHKATLGTGQVCLRDKSHISFFDYPSASWRFIFYRVISHHAIH